MSDTFTRQELFDLVWSAPTRTVAKQLGISDVGLAKACRRANLLLSPRGYWAKIAAGKKAEKPQLPPRGPGMSDRIVLRPSRWGWGHDTIDLSTPDPPVPTFSETLDELYPKIGDRLKQRWAGWRAYIFTGNALVQKLIGLAPSRRIPLFNGPLECRLYEFMIVEGSMRKKPRAIHGNR